MAAPVPGATGYAPFQPWSRTYRVLVPDLPGLGESDFPPVGDDAVAIATIVADGIDAIVGGGTSYDVVGFSFGGTMAACVGALRGKRVRSVTIIGSSGVGAIGSAVNLEKVRHLEGQERRDTHRINLNRLMIADPAKIDDLAILIQDWNTVRSRLRTPAISRSGAIMKAIDQLQSPLNGMWGELDAPANPKGPERGGDVARPLPGRRHPADPRDRALGRLRIRRHGERESCWRCWHAHGPDPAWAGSWRAGGNRQ